MLMTCGVKDMEIETPRQYPTEAQRIRLTARRLAEECFQEVERRFAAGTMLDKAKRDVLEQRVPGFLEEYGPEIVDRIIQSVMSVTESGTDSRSRRAHRERRWLQLSNIPTASGNPPKRLDHLLFLWFGKEPR